MTLLRSVVDVRGMKIALYPCRCTTVNILYETNRENSDIFALLLLLLRLFLSGQKCNADTNIFVKRQGRRELQGLVR